MPNFNRIQILHSLKKCEAEIQKSYTLHFKTTVLPCTCR